MIENNEKDKSGQMLTLDPNQLQSLELFREDGGVTSKQSGDLFGFQPRSNATILQGMG